MKLKELFEEFGEIISLSIPKTGANFGFVCFKEPEQAQAAIAGLHNVQVDEGGPLEVKEHLKKAELKKREQNELKKIFEQKETEDYTRKVSISGLRIPDSITDEVAKTAETDFAKLSD